MTSCSSQQMKRPASKRAFGNIQPGLAGRAARCGVSVSGCLYNGIDIGRGEVGTGDSTTVESCTVRTVGGYGITGSSVTHCTAYETGSGGIFATTASDCFASSAGNGLYAGTASNCSARSE